MINDISCGTDDNEEECLANVRLVSLYARTNNEGQWSFFGSGSEKKLFCVSENSIWDNIAEKMLVGIRWKRMSDFLCYDSIVQRSTQQKEMVKCRYTMQPTTKRLRLFFAQLFLQTNSVFTEQAQRYVKSMNPFTRERGDPFWWDNQITRSFSVPSRQKFLWRMIIQHIRIFVQQHEERTEKLSQQDKLNKFRLDAGFLSVVENGQHFMTKDGADLSQFQAIVCREYILPRENEAASQPKGWIQGNTKIGPVLGIMTSCLHGKHGVEIRTWFLNKDNIHSWVRIFHGSKELVMSLNNKQKQKFSKISQKNKRYNWMWRILHADRKQKQNRKEKIICWFFTMNSPWWEKELD